MAGSRRERKVVTVVFRALAFCRSVDASSYIAQIEKALAETQSASA